MPSFATCHVMYVCTVTAPTDHHLLVGLPYRVGGPIYVRVNMYIFTDTVHDILYIKSVEKYTKIV